MTHPVRRLAFLACFTAASATTQAAAELTFERDVRPILKTHCFQCHGEGEKLKGGVDLRLRRFMVGATKGGIPCWAGQAGGERDGPLVREGEMPEKGKKLTPEEIAILEKWIAQGAKTARAEPAEVPKYFITEEEREFWAFQPITRPAVPPSRDPKSDPHSDRRLPRSRSSRRRASPSRRRRTSRTLIRRVTLDLTGLPPTPEEVALSSPTTRPTPTSAWSTALLASPHYGERWGRHWLDVAGYADSDGYTDADPVRPWAYKYRDYVIRSFNADKPFDQFIREQLAGDEMVAAAVQEPRAATPIDKLTATGFLRMAPDGTGDAQRRDQKVARNAVVAETIKVVSSSLLGLTVGCAQCHDHRYDPIPQADYYRLRAIFEPALDHEKLARARRAARLAADRRRAREGRGDRKGGEGDRRGAQGEARTSSSRKCSARELAAKPEELREPLRARLRHRGEEAHARAAEAAQGAPDDQPAQRRLALSLRPHLQDEARGRAEEDDASEAAEVRKRKPVEEFVPALTEVPRRRSCPATFLFNRGDPDQPRGTGRSPASSTILAALPPDEIPEKAPALPTTRPPARLRAAASPTGSIR